MNRISPRTLILIGLIGLTLGWLLKGCGATVSKKDREACEASLKANNSDDPTLLDKCREPGMVAAIKAQGQNLDAAQAIGSANQGSTALNMLSSLLQGIGLVALGFGIVGWRKALRLR